MSECCVCSKTVYVKEEIRADGRYFHKTCFKCSAGCGRALKIENFRFVNDVVLCATCVPRDKPTSVMDLATAAAVAAPKPHMGSTQFQKGTGERPTIPADAQSIVAAQSASKVQATAVKDKFQYDGEKPSIPADAFEIKGALDAPKQSMGSLSSTARIL